MSIQREDVTAGGGADAEIHRRRETHVLSSSRGRAVAGDSPHDVSRAVAGVVVHDQDLGQDTALAERGLDGNRQIHLVVVGDDDDRDVNHGIDD